jgi:hypothetical protein
MADALASPKSMLRRAKSQIADLDVQIKRFAEEKPWSFVAEDDLDRITNEPVTHHKVKFTSRLSEDLPHITFEAANNLRAILDQLGYAVAILNQRIDPKACKFPIGPTEVDARNNAKGGCKDLPPEIVDLFISFKPYKGGNNAIWALNELANTPKHKLLYPFNMIGGSTMTSKINILGDGMVEQTYFWNSEKNEIVFLVVSGKANISYNANITFSVALDGVDQVIRGQHPVTVLRTMTGEVERVLMATEAECRRIGLIKE